MLNVCHFANTIVGKPGNIGVRTERIIRALSEKGGGGYCLSRQAWHRSPRFFYRDMGWIGHIPRILKAIRIYVIPGFNFRYPSIKLFEWFALRHLPEVYSISPGIAHVWDSCPRLMHSLKAAGFPIVLDIPIAPGEYALRISQQFGISFLKTRQNKIELDHAAYERADVIVAPSKFVADELLAVGVKNEKIRIIEFGVDIKSQFPIRNIKKNSGDIDFVFVGNVNRRKGVDLLVSAWDNADFKNDRLHLCGRVFPEIKPYLTSKHGGNILTPGFINPFDYLQQCDVFVFPSWLEGSAKAVYEAMACGLPVIVTDSSGSVVRHGIDGFVIKAGDVDALRECMQWFKSKPEQIEIMGNSARNRVQDFTWQRYADRIIDLYKELGS